MNITRRVAINAELDADDIREAIAAFLSEKLDVQIDPNVILFPACELGNPRAIVNTAVEETPQKKAKAGIPGRRPGRPRKFPAPAIVPPSGFPAPQAV